MGATFNTGYLENLILYNGSNNIGIGTSADATYKVTLGGSLLGTTANFSGNLSLQGAVTRNINFYDSSNTNINAQIQYDQITSNSGQLFFGTNNAGTFATRLTIANTGAATFSSSIAASGTISISTDVTMLRFGNLLRWGFQRPAADNRYVSFMRNMNATATAVWTVDGDNGNVGIGTPTPTGAGAGSSLDVTGPIVARGHISDHQTSATVMQYYNGESWIRAYGATSGSGILVFRTGGGGGSSDSERLRITSAGDMYLTGRSTNGDYGMYFYSNDTESRIYSSNSSAVSKNLIFYTAGNPRMTITSGGNVGIGTSSPSSLLHIVGASATLIVADSTSYAAGVGGKLSLQGNYRTQGDIAEGGYIKASKTNATNGDYGFDMIFATHNYTAGVAERMRITSGGNVRIGTNTSSPTELLEVNSSAGGGSTHYTLFLYNTRSGGQSSGDYYTRFFSNTENGSIRANGTGGINYNNTSDARLKTDDKDFDALSIVQQLKPKDFKWIHYNERSHGFYAQELYNVYPQAVSIGGDEFTEDGLLKNPWQVDVSKLVPLLTKAIQELKEEIDILKNK